LKEDSENGEQKVEQLFTEQDFTPVNQDLDSVEKENKASSAITKVRK
jgi:hypothetical protein